MKNRWILILVIFILIIIIGVFISVLFLQPKHALVLPLSTNPFADSALIGNSNLVVSPDTFAINFYKWYIGNREVNPSFPTSDQLTTSFTQWATSSFILQYQSTINDPGTDADPILYAQDDPRGWGSGITGTILSQTNTTSSVKVVIGSGTIHTYIVQLIKNNGQWFVNSITGTY